MNKRNKRILWLLNHKTLMPYEAVLLQDLGFEVFTPKIIPATEEYRSCIADYRLDATLTIPQRCLERLNAFNFYESMWTPEIIALVNRYFGTAFALMHRHVLSEVLHNFEGHIALRAFGIPDATLSYTRVIEEMCGPEIVARMYAVRERLWFAQGYEQLQECEPPLLADRAIFLPFGLPASSWRHANCWNGSVKKILFMCRWVVSNRYYAFVYQQFKRDFGDLPHVIVGAQDIFVVDPNLVGYVSDDELQQLYLDCAVLYYPSREPRHVHYSPIEASIDGMPVVFYNDSLLGRLNERLTIGSVATTAQARSAMERILAGDQAFIDEVRREEQQIAYRFSDAYCRPVWQRAIATSALFPRPAVEQWPTVWAREALRIALAPLAHGLSHLPDRGEDPFPPFTQLQEPATVDEDRGSLVDGIDFTAPQYPKIICRVSGMSYPEPWGRWSLGSSITFLLNQFLERRFRLVVIGGAYGNNIGARIQVRIGPATRTIIFLTGPQAPTTVTAEFFLASAVDRIEFRVPFPTIPAADNRAVGIGLIHMRVEPMGG